jgi:predicted nucleic acid-binding protein
MNVIDSSGWLEYFASASNAEAFAQVIESGEKIIVPTVVLFEVGRRIWQQRGEAAAGEAMDVLRRFSVAPVNADIAVAAVALGQRHNLALADSLIYATAQSLGATVWSQDRDFEGVPGVTYVPKPPQHPAHKP